MTRTVTGTAPTSLLPAVPHWRGAVGGLLALSRHAVWLVALFIVLATWVQVRLEVQQLRLELDQSGRQRQAAQDLNNLLRLEIDTRSRAVAMERIARDRSWSNQVPIIRLTEN